MLIINYNSPKMARIIHLVPSLSMMKSSPELNYSFTINLEAKYKIFIKESVDN